MEFASRRRCRSRHKTRGDERAARSCRAFSPPISADGSGHCRHMIGGAELLPKVQESTMNLFSRMALFGATAPVALSLLATVTAPAAAQVAASLAPADRGGANDF